MDVLEVSPISAIAALTVIFLTAVYYWIKNRDVPPGPIGLPYLGLFPFLKNDNASQKFEEYKNKYGDVFSFTYTGRLYINLGTVKAMRELQVNKSEGFINRCNDASILADMLKNGVTFVNGEPWKVLRKFFIQRFKEYGLTTVRDNMAGPIYDSVAATIDDLKTSIEKGPVNIVEVLNTRCVVTMRKILFGEKGVTDEELGKMMMAYGGALDGATGVNMLLVGPLARLLLSIKPSYRENFRHHRIMCGLILDCVKRIEASMDEENPTCVIEDFLKERNERRRNNDPSWKIFSDDALVESLLQFAGDGILAVAIFIAAILNSLQDYPDEQEKLYNEIMEVVGPNRLPTAEDRPNMPYINALISECIRTTNMIEYNPSVECSKETKFRGYKIPVGAITILNFWSAHHDPETYEDPYTFKPSRYMPSPGKPKAEPPVLFGMGKRSCSGEAFVLLQAFLFLTTIVKNFKIVSSNLPSKNYVNFLIQGKLELTLIPREQHKTV